MKQIHIGRREAAYIITFVIAVLFLVGGNRLATRGKAVFGRDASTESIPAKVDIILARDAQSFTLHETTYEHVIVYYEAVITGGSRKGNRITGEQLNDPLLAVQMKEVEEGDRIMVCLVDRSDGHEGKVWTMQEYDRSRILVSLALIFFVLLILFGGKKGLATVVSLSFTCIAIFGVFVPAILSGHNIVLWTWVTCLFIIAVTLVLVNGFSVKSLSAGIGCTGGLILAGLLFRLSDVFLKLTGIIDEDSVYLTMLQDTEPIDLKGIIFASILIGVLGAAMDVGVSISAALSEVRRTSGMNTMRELILSGTNIGRDIACTMANTLILVYIGSALSFTLLLVVYSNSFLELINRETIVVEILQALIGSIGLLFTIPLTSACYAFIATHTRLDDGDFI